MNHLRKIGLIQAGNLTVTFSATSETLQTMLSEGKSQAQIARDLGVHKSTVGVHLRKLGLLGAPKSGKPLIETPPQQLREWFEAGMDFKNMASQCGVGVAGLIKHLRQYQIVKYDERQARPTKDKPSDEVLRHLFYDELLSFADIGQRFGMCDHTIHDHMLKHKIVTPGQKQASPHTRLTNIDSLRQMYIDANMSLADISALMKVSKTAVSNRLRRAGIIKPDNVKRELNMDRNSSQHHYRRKSYVLPSGRVVRVQGYEPMLLDQMFKQGNLSEYDFCFEPSQMPEIKYLDSVRKCHRYIPDLYCPGQQKVWEVKSDHTLKMDQDTIWLKQQATNKCGLAWELVVFDRQANIIQQVSYPEKAFRLNMTE